MALSNLALRGIPGPRVKRMRNTRDLPRAPHFEFKQRGPWLRGEATMPDGQRYQADVHLGQLEQHPVLAGWFKRFRRRFKKSIFGKIILGPVLIANKITHTGPLAKLHDKVQKWVGKALPFTKPFIAIHNKFASATQKALGAKGLKKAKTKLTLDAIMSVTKDIPIAQRADVRKALVAHAQQHEVLVDAAKSLIKKRVLSAAIKQAKGGNPAAKTLVKTALQRAVIKRGNFLVQRPDGALREVSKALVNAKR